MVILFDTDMQNEKIAVAGLIIIIIGALSIYLVTTYYQEGKIIEAGDCADVHYIGRFASNGTVFDTSYDDPIGKTGGTPKKVFVNPNWDLSLPSGEKYQGYSSAMMYGFLNGLVGMKEGETRNLTIPSEEAYGDWNMTSLNEYYELIFGTSYYPRYIQYNSTEIIPIEYLPDTFVFHPETEVDITNLSVGQIYTYMECTSQSGENVDWQLQITNISDDNVL